MAYSPAFQFYPAEYLGDKNTFPMTTVEHGAYCLLMWFCWEEDGLPDDLEELAGMARLTVDQFKPIWDRRLKKCFVFDEKKNLYFHPRLLKEIKKQKAWKKEKSERGKRAAVSRWKQNGLGDAHALPTHADAMPKHASSSSSLSSFKNNNNKGDRHVPFKISDEAKQWAKETVPNVKIKPETAKFDLYYTTGKGKETRSEDWQTGWRMWMVNAEIRATPKQDRNSHCSTCDERRRIVSLSGSNPCPDCRPAEYAAWLKGRDV